MRNRKKKEWRKMNRASETCETSSNIATYSNGRRERGRKKYLSKYSPKFPIFDFKNPHLSKIQ
jgi:hypothetical protein